MILLFLLFSTAIISARAEYTRVVCYTTNWGQYRPAEARFLPEDTDPFLCTHLIYAFARLTYDGHLAAYEWNDEDTGWSSGMYNRTMALKKLNPDLKILLAVGGWNFGSYAFSQMVNSNAYRKTFVESSVSFLKTRGFDGLDLDWEYPANRGGIPSDRKQFTILCKELQEAYKKNGLLVTVAVSAGKPTIDSAYEVAQLSQNVDMINLMSYDLHGAWESFTGHNSPLYARADEKGEQRQLNIDWAANYWVEQGASKEKINIGLATYGRAFRLVDQAKSTLGSTASGAGSAGEFTREAGFVSYYEVCRYLKQGWTKEWNSEQLVPYIHKGTEWVGYDDIASLTEKTNYVTSKGYGGVMFWALDLDDFNGTFCGQGRYPLINAVKQALFSGGKITTKLAPVATTTAASSDIGSSDNDPSTNQDSPKTTRTTTTTTTTTTPKHCAQGDKMYTSGHCVNAYYECVHSGTADEMIVNHQCSPGTVFNPACSCCDWAYNCS